jgi:hypothetical protein
VKIFLPGDDRKSPSIKLEIPRENFERVEAPDNPKEAIFEAIIFIPIIPLQLKEQGRIRVVATCGKRTTKLGSLKVLPADQQQAVQS